MHITLEANTRAAFSLNQRHAGEHVFVLGTGPHLGELTEAERRWLESQTTIALNKAVYVVEPTYVLSAYPSEIMLALQRSDRVIAIHMRPIYEPPLFDQTIAVKRIEMNDHTVIHPAFVPPVPALVTHRNVALAATQLAVILGAAKVTFLGVEQRNSLHFYDGHPEILQEIRDDILSLADYREVFKVDKPDSSMEAQLEQLGGDPEVLRNQPFYEWDHAPTFRTFFERLGSAGVEFTTAIEDSVISDAGASHTPLREFMDGS